jgi:glycosyltransferase involved in cell wall biosynthesis
MNILIDTTAFYNRAKDSRWMTQWQQLLSNQDEHHYYFINFNPDISIYDLIDHMPHVTEQTFRITKHDSLHKNRVFINIIKHVFLRFIFDVDIDVYYLLPTTHHFILNQLNFTDLLQEHKITTINKWSQINTQKTSSPLIKPKKTIAIFTPLPPTKSGISYYSLNLIKSLSDTYQITIFINQKTVDKQSLNINHVNVLNHKMFHQMAEAFDTIIYHIGNHALHEYMIPYLQNHPGIVVLHDHNLHDLAWQISLRSNNLSLYEAILKEDYSLSEATQYIDTVKEHGIIDKNTYPVNGFILKHATKIIVHSHYIKRILLEKRLHYPIYHVYSPTAIHPLKNNQSTKHQHGFKSTDFIISTFGYGTEAKRLLPILKAFHRLSSNDHSLKLMIVGAIASPLKKKILHYINTHQLTPHVYLQGFVSSTEYDSLIQISDICLNLRYPYFGETSASLMRLFGHGKCTIITDIGAFKDIPSDVAYKLPIPKYQSELDEINLIYNALKHLKSTPKRIEKYEQACHQYAKEFLAIDKVTNQYINVINAHPSNQLINNNTLNELFHTFDFKRLSKEDIHDLSKLIAYALGTF